MALEEIRDNRIKKLEKIKKAGLSPYPAKSKRTHKISEAVLNFEKLSQENKEVFLTGRARLIRGHGGSAFMQIEDESGKFQVFAKRDELGEEKYKFLFDVLDIGDFLEANGTLFLTQKGEKTLLLKNYKILAKTILPLPEKWHGIQDTEDRFRKRYLDLAMNENVRKIFRKRGEFLNAIREFMQKNNFLEVETSVLEDVPGGADAEPFITHHNYLDKNFYLRISLELHLKRLIVGGYENVYEIGKVFRNEGMDTEHLQEFTMLEFYSAYKDYNWLMDFTERLYTDAVEKTFGALETGGLNFKSPWPKIDYFDIFREKTGIDLYEILAGEDGGVQKELFIEQVKKLNLSPEPYFGVGIGRIIDQVYKRLVRPNIKGPAFLIHHPIAISPLAKKKEKEYEKQEEWKIQKTERFQILINGSEIGNGFSELNDPLDQRARFEEQARLREMGDKEAQMIDEDFISALEYGMPPTGGFGVGIDRLFMAAAGLSSIRETVFFPMMG